MYFSRAPLVGISGCLMLGIVLAHYAPHFLYAFRVTGFVSIIVILTVAGLLCYTRREAVGCGICIALFFVQTGAFLKMSAEADNDAALHSLEGKTCQIYEAEVRSMGEKRFDAYRYEVRVDRIRTDGDWQKADLKALISIDTAARQPAIGDRILVKGHLRRPAAAQNPGQFDYQAYLRTKGILWIGKVKAGGIEVIGHSEKGLLLKKAAADISNWSDMQLQQHIRRDGAYALIKAMVLGRRDDLGEEQVRDYVASGAVHILSVSGMHVAIIFYLLTLVLGWLRQWKWGNVLYVNLIMALIGFYALATGLSPSVQRSAMMCAVFVLSEMSGRRQFSMNTLALSALVILLIDVQALYDVGFQLSFLAMAGIFLLYQPIYELYKPGNRLDRFIWQVTAMGLAAQLMTFPLCAHYFHQFPTYFWLVNPLIIGATNVLLPAALGLLLVAWMPFHIVHWPFSFVAEWSAELTNWVAKLPQYVPGYLVDSIFLSISEIVALYATILLGYFAWQSRNYFYLKLTAMAVLVSSTTAISQSLQNYLSDENIAFNIPKHQVTGWKRGNSLFVISNQAFEQDQRAQDFYLINYLASREINEVIFLKRH